jgi:DNA-binding transcriptional MerR regulator
MDDVQEFFTIKRATKVYGGTSQLLRKWEEKGLLKALRTPRNTRMYRRTSLETANEFFSEK